MRAEPFSLRVVLGSYWGYFAGKPSPCLKEPLGVEPEGFGAPAPGLYRLRLLNALAHLLVPIGMTCKGYSCPVSAESTVDGLRTR